MPPKLLECLVVDGNYSQSRVMGLLGAIFAGGVLIWLIVLTAQLEPDLQNEKGKH